MAAHARRRHVAIAAAMAGAVFLFDGATAEGAPEGDRLRSLGAHLSTECAACHESGGPKGIPVISGLEPETFIRALKDYRDGLRDNPVMASVARSLNEDEMRALAAYFQSAGRRGRR